LDDAQNCLAEVGVGVGEVIVPGLVAEDAGVSELAGPAEDAHALGGAVVSRRWLSSLALAMGLSPRMRETLTALC